MAVKLEGDFDQIVKDSAITGAKWKEDIAQSLRIENYRFKNVQLAPGKVFKLFLQLQNTCVIIFKVA